MAMVSTDLPQRGDRALIEIEQAYVPAALGRPGVEMYQKGHSQPVFARMSMAASDSEGSDGSDLDTEFEEDDGDFDDYQGRRSEESVGYVQLCERAHLLTYCCSTATPPSPHARSCGPLHQTTSKGSISVCQ